MSSPTEALGASARVQRRRAVVRAVIAAVAVLLGVAQAIVWSTVAPGQQVLVYEDGAYASLPTADYHLFDGLALAAFSGAAIGLIVTVAAWRVRAIRGAMTLITVGAGTAVGGAICYLLGSLLAGGVDPASMGATGSRSIVDAGASMGTPLVIVVEPLFAIATYTFLAAWDGRTDLGVARAVTVSSESSGAAAGDDDAQPGPRSDDAQPAERAAGEHDARPAEPAGGEHDERPAQPPAGR